MTRKSPHKLTFKLADGSLTVSRLVEEVITPKLALKLWREGYREYKSRGKAWKQLHDIIEGTNA